MCKNLIFVADYFMEEIRRGAEVCNDALIQHIKPEKTFQSSDVVDIDSKYFYIITNFVNLKEEIKQKLIKNKNYLIYEHDHKYTPTRNPFINPDRTINEKGVVPEKFLINLDFYNNAKVCICQTSWHQNQLSLQKHISCRLDNIHGSIYTHYDLDILTAIRVKTEKKPKYAIFNDSEKIYLTNGLIYNQGPNIKNKFGAVQYCIENKIPYVFIPRINNKEKFWTALASFENFIFFPDVPETCSRLLIEAKMLGSHLITNTNSGAYHEDWFKLSGQKLIDYFRDKIIPEAIKKFKGYINE